MPDNDQFARASKSAKVVFKPSNVSSGEWIVDHVALAVTIERLFRACGGVPAFRAVLAVFKALNDEPLFAGVQDIRDKTLEDIELVTEAHGRTPLDLVLRRAATREILDGRQNDAQSVAERFFSDLITRYVVEAKGGLVEQISTELLSRERGRLQQEMIPVVRLAAAQLVRNPDLSQIRLASHFRRESDVATADVGLKGFSYAESA